MTVIADRRARPMLWLVGAGCVSILFSWYPEAVDRSIPQESDSRIWMMYPALAPYVLAAFFVGVAAYCFFGSCRRKKAVRCV
jgi:hypothetical protein